ncbi:MULTISPECIES: SDR family oxidoreductase [Exiguobacterium]|uniref:SDR family oxidoreductase n=1 Tax=Exiguobacterium TaxID=33986 RepID=UPI001BE9C6FD|nr:MULTISPECIES: SDR family oxidoreductase [Exiguobacterium]MCT4790995.1 SDR family oxidoreductase [Exiguobacterium artemiae]
MTDRRQLALITGASHPQDIGTAICRKLAAQGLNICFTYWKADSEWIHTFQAELSAAGISSEAFEIDLSAPDAAERVLAHAVATIGTPSLLINNAAHSTHTDFATLDVTALDAHYAVNVRSTLLLSTLFARAFAEAGLKDGRIVNLTSGQDLGAMPEELAYAATKGAVSSFTTSFAAAVAPLGITVNALNPGPTDSTWMTEEIRTHLTPQFPFGRIGTPEDAARTIAFLVSKDAAWITGQVIHAEGGFSR